MLRAVPAGSVAYDIGANYGMHTLFLSRLVGAYGRVYAFEPAPAVFHALEENIALNAFTNVTAVRSAVAEVTGAIGFDGSSSTALGHITTMAGPDLVPVTTLDDFVVRGPNPPPAFIKVDVEGAESRVLQGGLDVLRRHRPTLLIELHTPTEDVAVGRILQDLNYEAFRLTGERVVALESGWPNPDGIWGTVLGIPSRMRARVYR
jgi:FkbM family methyltransferase